MHHVTIAQAVEAAKCPNCKYPLDVPWEGDGKTFVALSAPGPSRDAEWCREFVVKCRNAFVRTSAYFDPNVLAGTIEELATELTDALRPVVPGWMPIETAPKDKPVVIYHRLWTPVVRVGHYRDDSTPSDWIAYEGKTGWYVCGIPPTHWQPLPNIPTEPAK